VPIKALEEKFPIQFYRENPSKTLPLLAATCQHISYLDKRSECENRAAPNEK
jgi:hypothetical protein